MRTSYGKRAKVSKSLDSLIRNAPSLLDPAPEETKKKVKRYVLSQLEILEIGGACLYVNKSTGAIIPSNLVVFKENS